MKWRVVFLLGLVSLSIILNFDMIGSYILSNAGLLRYVAAIQNANAAFPLVFMQAEVPLFRRALAWYTRNVGAQRGLGSVYWRVNQDSEAFTVWKNIPFTAEDYIVFGQHAASREDALRWYHLTEAVEPANPMLWLEVGRLCRYDMTDVMCDRFLTYNHGNRLVDPEFIFSKSGWLYNRLDKANYAITECPDIPDEKCALAHIEVVTSPHGTGWLQCFILEPGYRYRFSAWIKVETAGKWIPIHYQGDINGHPDGHDLGGIQIGKRDWSYWTREFTPPEFDDWHACFYPVRLLDVGQVWFHSAELRMVE